MLASRQESFLNSESLDFASNLNLVLDSESSVKVRRLSRQGCISIRSYVAFMSLLGCLVMYINRVNLSVTIVAMVNQTSTQSDGHIKRSNHTVYTVYACYATNYTQYNTSTELIDSTLFLTDDIKGKGEFEWSETTQGIILGAFDAGYIWLQIPFGRISELYGPKWICGLALLLSAVINMVTPFIVRYSLYAFIGSRLVLGLTQSAVLPAMYALLNRWIPEDERSTYLPWLQAGCLFGTIIAMIGSGELIKLDILGGWPLVFYVSGVIAIVWFIVWTIFVRSDPGASPWVSDKELEHIILNTEELEIRFYKRRETVPWRKILSSRAFISVALTKCMLNASFSFLLSKIPTYLENIIGLTIDENGYIDSIIYCGNAFSLLFGGYLADVVINRFSFRKTNVRKSFEGIAAISMSVLLVLVPLFGCNKTIVIILLTSAATLYGLCSGGDVPIVTDMTSEFPATIFGIMNSISEVNGFITPYVVGLIVNSNPYSMQLWSYCFYYSALMNVLGILVFILFASAKKQVWT